MKYQPSAKKAITLFVGLSIAPAGYAELEEIVVSATKRVESLQDVPISVSAISAETMRDAGVDDIADVSLYIPNFEVSDASILPNLYIRGIGSGTTHSIEQSVGRFIDEVYIGRAAINLHGFMDIASVEVLRGPQGTLFGKNTLGGAMIIHTANPTEELAFGLDASVSNYSTTGGQQKVESFVSGAISDSVRGRLAMKYRNRDGYIDNRLPGPDGGTREDFGIRAKLAWDAGENTTVNLKLEHMEYEEEGQTPSETVSVNGNNSAAAAGLFVNAVPSFTFGRQWESYIDCGATLGPAGTTFCPGRDQDSQNVTLKIDHEWAEVGTLTSVSGYQKYDYVHDFVAIDQGIIGGSLRATRAETYEGFTQEFRFTSKEQGHYDYIAGAYYENSDLERLQPSDFDVNSFVGAPLPPSGNSTVDGGPPHFSEREDWVQTTETIALFGQLRWFITDDVTAIAGGRWSREDKDFRFELATVAYQENPNPVIDELFVESRTEEKFTPSLTLRWETNDAVMFYASVAKGHKTGGFSDRIQDPLEFEAEENLTYELGMKGLWLGGDLETNIALFHMSIDDLQVARALPGSAISFEIRNAAEATSQGVEFDGRWLLSDQWTIGGNLAYTDATYDDFPGAAGSCPRVGGRLENGLCNYAGIPLIYAPEWKGSLFLQYQADDVVGGWGLNARLSTSYASESYPELNYIETLKQDDYSTVDASIRFSSPKDKYSLALIGRNLTDEYVIAWGLQAGFTEYVAPNAPRELTLQASYRF